MAAGATVGKRLRPLSGHEVGATQAHDLRSWLGIIEVGNLEPKPGYAGAGLSRPRRPSPVRTVEGVTRARINDPKGHRVSERRRYRCRAASRRRKPKAKKTFGLFDDTFARVKKVKNSMANIELSILNSRGHRRNAGHRDHVPRDSGAERGIVFSYRDRTDCGVGVRRAFFGLSSKHSGAGVCSKAALLGSTV